MYSFIWQKDKDSDLNIVSGFVNGYPTKKAALAEAERIGTENVKVILTSEINVSRKFRDAWMHDKTDSPQNVSVQASLARDISVARVRANVKEQFSILDKEVFLLKIGGSTEAEAIKATQPERDRLKAATDRLKALDVNKDDIISVEEADGQLLPLELID